jgi:hypothetical protein
MLAGICVSRFTTRGVRFGLPVYLAILGLAGLWLFALVPFETPALGYRVLTVAGLAVLVLAVRVPPPFRVVAAAVVLALQVAPLLERAWTIQGFGAGSAKVDVEEYFEPNGAATFLLDEVAASGIPSRYFGYDIELGQTVNGFWVPYRRQYWMSETAAILVNNRATMLGLYDIQGQNNPIQIERYQELFVAINGYPLEYHEAVVFREGFASPYLDLLNVRYIVIPAEIPGDREDLQELARTYPVVYQDETSQVLERPGAVGAAWLAHATTPADSAEVPAIDLATSPTDSAVPVEGDVPALEEPAIPEADAIEVLSHEPESVTYRSTSDVASLLVTCDVAYPGWNAYVDGEKVETLTAYGVFRSAVVPAGTHEVEFRFESTSLRLGTAISVVGYLALFGIVGLRLVRRTTTTLPAHNPEGMR